MKTFHCANCGGIAFFDDTLCTSCGLRLAYAADRRVMLALRPAGTAWHSVGDAGAAPIELCRNTAAQVCNRALAPGAPAGLCDACKLTLTIPNLARPGMRAAWARLEHAKRRLLWTLVGLGLSWTSRAEDPLHGLSFEFLADADMPAGERAMTGHTEGRIVVSAEEADDAILAQRRVALREPYRSVLGHFRHEVGHYYWNRLIRDRGRLEAFRALFGDERADYAQAKRAYYAAERSHAWREAYISEYASMHPWEDWAESFAHYLHMVDGVETAIDLGVRLASDDARRPSLDLAGIEAPIELPFDALLSHWSALSVALNEFNRGMGLADVYPFAPSAPAIAKFRFVDAAVRGA